MSVTWDELVELHAETLFRLCGGAWDELTTQEQEHGRELSRAALTAIREAGVRLMPGEATEDMTDACYDMELHMGGGSIERPSYSDAYTAMRDAGEIKPEGER